MTSHPLSSNIMLRASHLWAFTLAAEEQTPLDLLSFHVLNRLSPSSFWSEGGGMPEFVPACWFASICRCPISTKGVSTDVLGLSRDYQIGWCGATGSVRDLVFHGTNKLLINPVPSMSLWTVRTNSSLYFLCEDFLWDWGVHCIWWKAESNLVTLPIAFSPSFPALFSFPYFCFSGITIPQRVLACRFQPFNFGHEHFYGKKGIGSDDSLVIW